MLKQWKLRSATCIEESGLVKRDLKRDAGREQILILSAPPVLNDRAIQLGLPDRQPILHVPHLEQ